MLVEAKEESQKGLQMVRLFLFQWAYRNGCCPRLPLSKFVEECVGFIQGMEEFGDGQLQML